MKKILRLLSQLFLIAIMVTSSLYMTSCSDDTAVNSNLGIPQNQAADIIKPTGIPPGSFISASIDAIQTVQPPSGPSYQRKLQLVACFNYPLDDSPFGTHYSRPFTTPPANYTEGGNTITTTGYQMIYGARWVVGFSWDPFFWKCYDSQSAVIFSIVKYKAQYPLRSFSLEYTPNLSHNTAYNLQFGNN